MAVAKPIQIKDEVHLNELHRRYFSASRVPSLYGEGRTTRFQEYHILKGNLPLDSADSNILKRGRMLQRFARPLLAEERPDWEVRDTTLFFPHGTIARFGAAPDLLIKVPGRKGMGAGEVKVVAQPIFNERWRIAEGEKTSSPPLAVELQNQSQMACAKVEFGVILAIVIGAFTMDVEIYERELRPATVERVESDVAEFLRDVELGNEPAVDFAADTQALCRLYQQSDGKQHDFTANEHLDKLCEEYLLASNRESVSAAYKEIIKGEILSIITDGELALTAGHKITTKTVAATDLSFTRPAYRGWRITKRKKAKEE